METGQNLFITERREWVIMASIMMIAIVTAALVSLTSSPSFAFDNLIFVRGIAVTLRPRWCRKRAASSCPPTFQ